MTIVTVSPDFKITIPPALRRRLKIEPGSELQAFAVNGSLLLMPMRASSALRGIARGIDPQIHDEPEPLSQRAIPDRLRSLAKP